MDQSLNKLLVSKCSLRNMLKVNGYNYDEVEPDFSQMTIPEFKLYIEDKQYLGGLNDEDDNPSKIDLTAFFLKTGVSMSVSVKLSNIYTHKDTNEKLFLFMFDGSGTEKLGSKVIKKLKQICALENFKTGILFSSSEMTTSAFKELNGESFHDLRYLNANHFTDLTNYVYAPKILKIYRGQEAIEFFEKYGDKPKSLPKMALNDPVSNFYLLKQGDIIYFYIKPCIPEMFNPEIPEIRIVVGKNYLPSNKVVTTN